MTTEKNALRLAASVESRFDPDKRQDMSVAVIAVNAMTRLPMKPAPALLERAMAPSDEEFEEDPAGCIAVWGGIVERAHATYRARHKRSTT